MIIACILTYIYVRAGRVEPVPFHIKSDLTGLGKSSQDERMIESTVSQRRVLDSERQRKETEDQRMAREVGQISLEYNTRLMPHF